jgi:hypothetical protein
MKIKMGLKAMFFSFTFMIYPTKLNKDEESFWMRASTVHSHGI